MDSQTYEQELNAIINEVVPEDYRGCVAKCRTNQEYCAGPCYGKPDPDERQACLAECRSKLQSCISNCANESGHSDPDGLAAQVVERVKALDERS